MVLLFYCFHLKKLLDVVALSWRYPPRIHTAPRRDWTGLGWAGLALLGCTGLPWLRGGWVCFSCKYPPGIHPESTRRPREIGLGWLGWLLKVRLAWLSRNYIFTRTPKSLFHQQRKWHWFWTRLNKWQWQLHVKPFELNVCWWIRGQNYSPLKKT